MDTVETLEGKINRSDYKILIVDDVVSNVLLLKILLTNEKFQVCTANNGTMCIEMARKEHPDLILLDVMMPDMNGFDTATVLKKEEGTKDIPIIFLTALNTPQDLVHGFQVGASDFLTKPFNKEELVMRVTQQISLVAAKRIIEKQNQELRATLTNRDKMYSVIAHDLRSPMASIRMVLNLVVASASPETVGPELYTLLDQANRESEEVHDLLDNLLKWTKSQTGRLTVVKQDLFRSHRLYEAHQTGSAEDGCTTGGECRQRHAQDCGEELPVERHQVLARGFVDRDYHGHGGRYGKGERLRPRCGYRRQPHRLYLP